MTTAENRGWRRAVCSRRLDRQTTQIHHWVWRSEVARHWWRCAYTAAQSHFRQKQMPENIINGESVCLLNRPVKRARVCPWPSVPQEPGFPPPYQNHVSKSDPVSYQLTPMQRCVSAEPQGTVVAPSQQQKPLQGHDSRCKAGWEPQNTGAVARANLGVRPRRPQAIVFPHIPTPFFVPRLIFIPKNLPTLSHKNLGWGDAVLTLFLGLSEKSLKGFNTELQDLVVPGTYFRELMPGIINCSLSDQHR